MNFTNKHIVLIIIAIIIVAFIYNYDVYIVQKNQPICKPIYVTKKILTPDEEKLLPKNITNKTESFNNALIEGFDNFLSTNNNSDSNLHVPGDMLTSFIVPGVTDSKKIKVMDSVTNVLSNIPTNIQDSDIKQMIEYFAMLYETSNSLEVFYKNVAASTKIKEDPYNTKYAQLILFLIGKFNNDVDICLDKKIDKKCALMTTNIKDKNKDKTTNLTLESELDSLVESAQNESALTKTQVAEIVQKAKTDYLQEMNQQQENLQQEMNQQKQYLQQEMNNKQEYLQQEMRQQNDNNSFSLKSLYDIPKNIPKTMEQIMNNISKPLNKVINSEDYLQENMMRQPSVNNQLNQANRANPYIANNQTNKATQANPFALSPNNSSLMSNQNNNTTPPCTENCSIQCSINNSSNNMETFNNYFSPNELESFNQFGSNDYYQSF
jgi:hypothetical protein